MVTHGTVCAGLIAAFTAFVLHAVEHLFAFSARDAQRFAVIPDSAACASKHGWRKAAFAVQWRTYVAFLNRFAVAIAFILKAIQAEQILFVWLASA